MYAERPFNNFSWMLKSAGDYTSHIAGKGQVSRVEIRSNVTAEVSRCPYLLTPWCRVLLEKLTGLQLVKKFPAFHGTRRFITTPVSILRQPNPVHIPTSHLLEIHPNIIHSPTPRSLQWSFPSGFPTKNLYTPSPRP